MDAEQMRNHVRHNLARYEYNTFDFYEQVGFVQAVARSPLFEKTSLCIIVFYVIWIALDIENNHTDALPLAATHFQVVEHLVCMFFSAELLVRFLAFRRKLYAMRDRWFVFDSLLVFMMVLETWVGSAIFFLTGTSWFSGLGTAVILRLARLLRLARRGGMVKALRCFPELPILVTSMMGALRAVCFTMMFLVVVIYLFSIAFIRIATGTQLQKLYFEYPTSLSLAALTR